MARRAFFVGLAAVTLVVAAALPVWAHSGVKANSLTTYDTQPGLLGSVPATAGHGPTRWQPLAAASAYTWSDRRVVWNGGALPESVMTMPKQHHVVSHSSIPVTVAGVAGAISGRIDWVPPSDSVGLTMIGVFGFIAIVLGVAAYVAFPRKRSGSN